MLNRQLHPCRAVTIASEFGCSKFVSCASALVSSSTTSRNGPPTTDHRLLTTDNRTPGESGGVELRPRASSRYNPRFAEREINAQTTWTPRTNSQHHHPGFCRFDGCESRHFLRAGSLGHHHKPRHEY